MIVTVCERNAKAWVGTAVETAVRTERPSSASQANQ